MLLGPSPFFRREGAERALREGDMELLQKAARGKYWDARRAAAEALGRKAPAELLKDPVASVREAAVRALDLDAPTEPLILLLKDPDDAVRASAAWALRGRRAGKHLRRLLRDPSPTVRFAVLAATGDRSQLIALSKRPQLEVAVPALAALGRIGGPSDAANLVARLSRRVRRAGKGNQLPYYWNTPSADIALARAVGDLARRGVSPGGKSIRRLLRKIVDDNDLTGAGGILLAEAVMGARDAEAARRILDAQIKARKTSTRVNAYFDPALDGILHTFSREPWPALAPLLVPLLEDRDFRIRLAVIGALQGDRALPGLSDDDWRVRVAAVRRIRSVSLLERAARDESVDVRCACARALGRVGGKGVAPLLKKLLASEHATVRHRAVGALLRVAIPGRSDLLLSAATLDASRQVRAAAGAVLAFLDDPEMLPRAIAELSSEEAHVRRNAIALVHALTNARIDYDAAKPKPGATAWEQWWEARKQRASAPDAFRYHVEDLRRRGIDLVLAIDATGSMASVIQATKRRIVAVMRRLRDIVGNIRVRIVAYRDKGDVFLTLGSPLTHDPRLLEDFLACVPASGGGDTAEAVLEGLRGAIGKTPWRNKSRRVVLLFGDAPPHERDMTLLESIVKEFKGTIHTVHAGSVEAQNSPTAKAFRAIAKWSGGSYVSLRDEDDLLKSILVLALGPRHRAAVEALFGL